MAADGFRLTNVDGLKAAIAENVTISQVAEGLGVDLQASGEQWRGLCPLHEENTPSFYVHDGKGVYHCYGCKAGGDTIDLVERVRHLTFPEALHYLAAEADVDVHEYLRPMTDREKELEWFNAWCEDWLGSSMMPPPLRVSGQAAIEFGVAVHEPLPPNTPVYFNERSYLLDGVILPWRLPGGRLVGWRVREHSGDEKKVIGTPNDFPLGKITDQTLFGIQVAREHITDGRILLVEGEYDTMALHAAGIKHVAGMGGSTLTAGQAELLKQLRIREAVLLFDGDDAGRIAAKQAAERYWALDEMAVCIAVCPEDQDPETLVSEMGDMPIWVLYEQAPVALEYLLRLEWSARDRGSLTSKLEFVQWIRDKYGAKLRATEEALVLDEVADWLGLPQVDVHDFVRTTGPDALCAVDSERALLGQACRDQQFYIYLRSQLTRDDFFVLKHQRLWDLLADMLIDGQEFDSVTILSRAPRYGLVEAEAYLRPLFELGMANADYHIKQVSDLALRRTAREDALAFKDRIGDLQQPAELLVGDLTHQITSKALKHTGAAQRQLSEQVDEAMDILHQRMRNPSEVHGLDLGIQYPRFTQILQGLQARRLVLVSATSGVGKSTMLLTFAASLAVHQSVPIDFVSLEMDEPEILYKIASHMTGIDSMQITGGSLDSNEAKAVEYAMLRIRNSPLHVWAPDGMTGTEFLLHAREAVMQRRSRAFFVDYVQLIDPEAGQERDNGYKLYGDFGRLVKMKVARAMDVSVVCAAQLNRNAAAKERPTKEDMGDSYALVRHSDVIVVLCGQDESSTLEMWVDKNRQGPGNKLIPLQYDQPRNTFRESSGGATLPEYIVRP